MDVKQIGRRRFAQGSAAVVTLLVAGCECCGATGWVPAAERLGKKKGKKAKLAKEPFLIGGAEKYRGAGVYEEFAESKGVWVVSDGRELVVFSVACTHLACATGWDGEEGLFKCPCHLSQFDIGGINQTGGKAKRPLERCTVRLVEVDGVSQVEVDPTRRLRKDKGEWDQGGAGVVLG